MSFEQFIITYWKYILSALISGCFLVVNIIQAIRNHDKTKLKEAICRIPEVIRQVEKIANIYFTYSETDLSTTTAAYKASYKKATAESLIISEYGKKFFEKHKSVFDDAIEDILNTPQKKGGSDGISKENETR